MKSFSWEWIQFLKMEHEIMIKEVKSLLKMEHEIMIKEVKSISEDGTWNHDQGSKINF